MGSIVFCLSVVLCPVLLGEEHKPAEPKIVHVAPQPDGSFSLDLPAQASAIDPPNYMLVLGNLNSNFTRQVSIEQLEITQAEPINSADPAIDPWWKQEIARKHEQLVRRQRLNAKMQTHFSAKMPSEKSFHIFVREQDFFAVENYREVKAKLVRVGKSCAVYLDRETDTQQIHPELLDALVTEFDNHVKPNVERLLGQHSDVDRDGKFTILLTHWLSQLSNGKVSLGGFVRGADFYRDVDPPFSNGCDMMYLNTNLKPGPALRTLLAHEYTHAVTFSEHVFGEYMADRPGVDEEGWMSEAISHLAENLIGEGWSNLDYRMSAFLVDPARYQLVVRDYYRAGLWRCHGSRGATYLFLRWCVDQYGESTLRHLTQSNLFGIDNIELATQTPFEHLFRNWSIATSLAGINVRYQHGYKSVDFSERLEVRQLAGIRTYELDDCMTAKLVPTSFCPITLTPKSTPTRITIRMDQKANKQLQASFPPDRTVTELAAERGLQVTLIELPKQLPNVDVCIIGKPKQTGTWVDLTASGQKAKDLRQCQIRISQRSTGSITWESLTWERAFPPQEKSGDDWMKYRALDAKQVFEQPVTSTDQEIISCPVDLSIAGNEQIVVKLVGRDETGRKVVHQSLIDAESAAQPIQAADRTRKSIK